MRTQKSKMGTGQSRRTRTKVDWTQVILWIVPLLLGVPRADAQLTNYSRLHSFGNASLTGENPLGALAQSGDGALYGASSHGGSNGVGVLFKVQADGSGYGVMHHFDNSSGSTDGYSPNSGLQLASDGKLYGTTFAGGTNDSGTVFRINRDGSSYTVLQHFDPLEVPGSPKAVLEGTDGALYGATDQAVFRMNKDSGNLAVLYTAVDPNDPGGLNGLVQGSDGMLYGTSQYGGTNDYGTIFKLSTNGATFSVIWLFTGTNGDGSNPMTALVETSNGLLFGTTQRGGTSNHGTIFKLNKDGSSYGVAHNFTYSTNDGGSPNALIQGKDSLLYGTTQSGGISNAGTVFKLSSSGTGYGVVRSFVGGPNDGSSPGGSGTAYGGLVEGADGLLYGTTYFGGQFGLGTLFRLAKDGTLYSVLRHFIYWPADGVNPRTSLMEASDGALYGTTDYDGVSVPGTVFRLNKGGGGYSTLARFVAYANGPLWEGTNGALYGLTQNYAVFRVNKDGSSFSFPYALQGLAPNAPLLTGADGAFYGTTEPRLNATGAMFRLNLDGTSALLHQFTGAPNDGDTPGGPLINASDGLLYGTTMAGGNGNSGTVFRIDGAGNNYQLTYNFSSQSSAGRVPYGRLLEGSDGALFGLAQFGGGTNQGLIYKVNKDGNGYSELKAFTGIPQEGSMPADWLVEGKDGALYGVNTHGTDLGLGTLFKLKKDGSGFMVLKNFTDPTVTPVLMAGDGALYGTTVLGGDMGFGTIYRVGQAISLSKPPGRAILSLTGIPGYTYQLQRSIDLIAWTNLVSVMMPAGPLISYSDSNAPPKAAFYRARPQ